MRFKAHVLRFVCHFYQPKLAFSVAEFTGSSHTNLFPELTCPHATPMFIWNWGSWGNSHLTHLWILLKQLLSKSLTKKIVIVLLRKREGRIYFLSAASGHMITALKFTAVHTKARGLCLDSASRGSLPVQNGSLKGRYHCIDERKGSVILNQVSNQSESEYFLLETKEHYCNYERTSSINIYFWKINWEVGKILTWEMLLFLVITYILLMFRRTRQTKVDWKTKKGEEVNKQGDTLCES